jgi:lysozyme family protein
MSPSFLRAFNFVCSKRIEGGLSMDPEDPGNWTGGAKGKGELKGTKYGISARAYPDQDIAYLSPHAARELYHRDYWLPSQCEKMPPRLALVHFDTVVNTKPEIAALCLQKALGVREDGIIGPITLAAARSADQSESIPNYLAERAVKYASFKQFDRYGRGWMERIVRVAMEASR